MTDHNERGPLINALRTLPALGAAEVLAAVIEDLTARLEALEAAAGEVRREGLRLG